MADCSCTPNNHPFTCPKYRAEMDAEAHAVCQGQRGLLEQIKQETALLKQLRANNTCDHLGKTLREYEGTPIHRCPIYGECTKLPFHDDVQNCSQCQDHSAISELVQLPEIFASQFVPFTAGKGSGGSGSTGGFCCCYTDVDPPKDDCEGDDGDLPCKKEDLDRAECENTKLGHFVRDSCGNLPDCVCIGVHARCKYDPA